MDWGRAKTILIVSFLLLNMLLGYQLWSNRIDQAASTTDAAVLVEETMKLLESKNIQITADVPKSAPKLRQITGKLSDKYRNAAKVTLPQPIRYTGGFLGRNTIKEAMQQIGIDNMSVYKLDPVLGKDGVQVLTQLWGDYPLFEYTVELYENNGEITGYKQAYVAVQSGGDQKEQRVISAYTAIRGLAENGYLPEGSVIKDVKLGYHGKQFDSETQYMLPFWRVVLAEGVPYYVQAFTGEVLEGSQVTQTQQQ